MGYKPRAWRQVNVMFIPATGTQLYSGKGICTISRMFLCRKLCKNSRPGTSGLKQWGMSPTSVTICLQTREVHINRNAPGVYTYTGGSGKLEITLELSKILRKLLIATQIT